MNDPSDKAVGFAKAWLWFMRWVTGGLVLGLLLGLLAIYPKHFLTILVTAIVLAILALTVYSGVVLYRHARAEKRRERLAWEIEDLEAEYGD